MPAQGFVIFSWRRDAPPPSYTGQSFGKYLDLVQNHCFGLVLGAAPARLDGDIYREGVSGGTQYHKMLHFLCINNSANRNPNTPTTGAPNRRFPRRRVSPKRLLESPPPDCVVKTTRSGPRMAATPRRSTIMTEYDIARDARQYFCMYVMLNSNIPKRD